jgi:hypothetical protein
MEIASLPMVARNDGLREVCHEYQYISYEDSNQAKETEHLLPQDPAPFVLHPLEEKTPERVDGGLARQAIINGLVVFVRFEPELVGVGKEEQAEQQEEDDKSERRPGHIFLPRRDKKGHEGF